MTDIEAAGIATTAEPANDNERKVSALVWIIPLVAFWLWVLL